MKRLFQIFILTILVQYEVKAQIAEQGIVYHASMDNVKPSAPESSTSLNATAENSIATIPFGGSYYDNYYGAETFEVYAGDSVDLPVVYLKVASPIIIPITVVVVNCDNEELLRYKDLDRPLIIGYGLKPGLYFIHVIQGKKEMVLRFSKGV